MYHFKSKIYSTQKPPCYLYPFNIEKTKIHTLHNLGKEIKNSVNPNLTLNEKINNVYEDGDCQTKSFGGASVTITFKHVFTQLCMC